MWFHAKNVKKTLSRKKNFSRRLLYSHLQHHKDTITKTDARRKTQEDFFTIIFTSHFICKVRKGCVGFYCERELEITAIF